MDGILFASKKKPTRRFNNNDVYTGHGARPVERRRKTSDKTTSNVFSSHVEDTWTQKRVSNLAAVKNNHTFELAPQKKGIVVELVKGKKVNKDKYSSRSPILQNHIPVNQNRSRNAIPNDYRSNQQDGRARTAMTMVLNQEDSMKDLRREASMSPSRRPTATYNSSVMSQCMGKSQRSGNPQAADSTTARVKDVKGVKDFRSKYIVNSGAKMESLKDLDKKTKHAVMLTRSTIFDSDRSDANTFGPRKTLSPNRHKSALMTNVMQHDEGPMTKITSFNNKTGVQGKISAQSSSTVRTNTFKRMGAARNERVQDSIKQLY